MAELHWFPFFAKDWLASRARALMTHEQRGVYLDLLAQSWDDGSVEPSLPSDDASLASMTGLGPRWKKIGALIRAQFVEREWRLYNEKMSEVWTEQQAKHGKAVEKAKAAVAVREANRKKGRGSSKGSRRDHLQDDPQEDHGGNPGVKQSESEVVVEPTVLPSTAPSGALGAGTPRAPGAESLAASHALDDEYRRLLHGAATQWRVEHPEDWDALERVERESMRLNGKPLTELQASTLFEGIAERVRVRQKWVSRAKWGERKGEIT